LCLRKKITCFICSAKLTPPQNSPLRKTHSSQMQQPIEIWLKIWSYLPDCMHLIYSQVCRTWNQWVREHNLTKKPNCGSWCDLLYKASEWNSNDLFDGALAQVIRGSPARNTWTIYSAIKSAIRNRNPHIWFMCTFFRPVRADVFKFDGYLEAILKNNPGKPYPSIGHVEFFEIFLRRIETSLHMIIFSDLLRHDFFCSFDLETLEHILPLFNLANCWCRGSIIAEIVRCLENTTQWQYATLLHKFLKYKRHHMEDLDDLNLSILTKFDPFPPKRVAPWLRQHIPDLETLLKSRWPRRHKGIANLLK